MARKKVPFDLTPDFLQDVTLHVEDAERLRPIMTNWLTAHTYIRTLEANVDSITEMKRMLLFEIRFGGRLHMLHRLRGRFNNLRMRHEDRQLFTRG